MKVEFVDSQRETHGVQLVLEDRTDLEEVYRRVGLPGFPADVDQQGHRLVRCEVSGAHDPSNAVHRAVEGDPAPCGWACTEGEP